jgi:hypothetical protein
MSSAKTTACEQCNAPIDLTGRVGRPPHYCSAECRRAGHAAAEARRRAARKREIDRLREMVRLYEEAAVAA